MAWSYPPFFLHIYFAIQFLCFISFCFIYHFRVDFSIKSYGNNRLHMTPLYFYYQHLWICSHMLTLYSYHPYLWISSHMLTLYSYYPYLWICLHMLTLYSYYPHLWIYACICWPFTLIIHTCGYASHADPLLLLSTLVVCLHMLILYSYYPHLWIYWPFTLLSILVDILALYFIIHTCG